MSLWRCRSCDEQFDEPQIWPECQGEEYETRDVTDPEDREETMNEIRVCPRCHSSAIEQWQ